MRARCGREGRRMVELFGPELRSRADVVAALRLSAGSPGKRTVVVLVCDGDERIVLALDFAGAGVTDLAAVVELVAAAVHDRPGLHLIVGVFRETGPPCSTTKPRRWRSSSRRRTSRCATSSSWLRPGQATATRLPMRVMRDCSSEEGKGWLNEKNVALTVARSLLM